VTVAAPRFPRIGARRREIARTVVISIVLLAIALLCALPLYFVVVTAFKTQQEYAQSLFGLPGGVTAANFRSAWNAADIGTYMKNSAIVSSAAVVLSTVVAFPLAFAIAFLRFPGRTLLYTLCLVLLAVPPLLLLIPIFNLLVQLNLIDTLQGVILLYAALTTPFAVYLLVAYMRSLPASVIEAGVLDGSSVPGLMLRIIAPLCVPAIGTAAIFSFIFCWNEFIYAFVLLQDEHLRTLPAGLASLQGRFFTDFPVLMAGVTLSVLPVIGLYVFFQRFLVRGIAVGVD